MKSGSDPGPQGIYIHIPYCSGKCLYCGFCSVRSASDDSWYKYPRALMGEMELAIPLKLEVGTVYFGGGTPTVLSSGKLMEILEAVRMRTTLAPDAEITLEANPEGLHRPALVSLLRVGFNRISVGVQAFEDRTLSLLGRRHTSRTARSAVLLARDAGFGNVGVDLIYGIPGQTTERWRESLVRTLDLEPEHVSCYALTLEDGTVLEKRVREGKLTMPPEDLVSEMYFQAHEILTDAGFVHYEVSNYAKDDSRRSRHNTSYWEGWPYIGLGPSAHSFDGISRRWWNTRDIDEYIHAVKVKRLPVESSEDLTDAQIRLERIMLGMRCDLGVNLNSLPGVTSSAIASARGFVSSLEEDGMLVVEGHRLVPTAEGMLLADRLAVDLDGALTG
jgi:oxygen-independent coproporphyrinogen-3 oxidase